PWMFPPPLVVHGFGLVVSVVPSHLIVTFPLLGKPPPLTVTVLPGRPSVGLSVIPAATATYGPTYGPPPPTGGEPAGSIESSDVSAIARARFRRPLPVCSVEPAASALRAKRPTTTPFVASTDEALIRAAAPATSAAAADVPLIVA